MKTYFLFHDKWTEYIKADWAASRFPFDGFVVVEKTRPGFVTFLWRRMRRLGIRKVADALLESLAPDVCILMLMPIVQKKILSIPPLGMLVFHPGLTPEYRGTHSAFWAVLNRELWGIGWSLLRIDTGIDTGAVLAQASTRNPDPLSESHIMLAHRSHVEGLPGVVATLRGLQAGEDPHVSTEGRDTHNYTHPGWTDYLKYRKVLRQLRRERAS